MSANASAREPKQAPRLGQTVLYGVMATNGRTVIPRAAIVMETGENNRCTLFVLDPANSPYTSRNVPYGETEISAGCWTEARWDNTGSSAPVAGQG